jgi:hypothetical protein
MDAMTADKPRWIYRFDNYSRAFLQDADSLNKQRWIPAGACPVPRYGTGMTNFFALFTSSAGNI